MGTFVMSESRAALAWTPEGQVVVQPFWPNGQRCRFPTITPAETPCAPPTLPHRKATSLTNILLCCDSTTRSMTNGTSWPPTGTASPPFNLLTFKRTSAELHQDAQSELFAPW